MKYIDNSDDFAEKVAFADSHAGLQVAGSMQEVASQLQNLVAFVGLALVMAGVSPWIIPVVVITCLPSVVLAYRQERETYALNKSWARRNAFIQMYYQDCTRFQCLQETRFCGSCRTSAIRNGVAASMSTSPRTTLSLCATRL